MSDVEIVVKVSARVPKDVVGRVIQRGLSKIEEIRKYKGILKGMDV